VPSKNACAHLLVVAHPDDEALFFAGLLQTQKDWHVVCVTDGNADGFGAERQNQFLESCKKLKVKKAEIFKFPDIYDKNIKIENLIGRLKALEKFKKVFTHSILGEYGHRHHQDVSYAVHHAFKGTAVFSVAYNAYPHLKINLTREQFKKKTDVLWNTYGGETKRLINFLPAHSHEGFSKVSLKEIETIYQWVTNKKPLEKKVIKNYKWLIPYLESGGAHLAARPF
jgi:LmbE family N-acetylglucosaminyl deacetylase